MSKPDPRDCEWLTVPTVALLTDHQPKAIYDAMALGRRDPDADGCIPPSLVKRISSTVHVHRSWVFPQPTPLRNPNLVELTQAQMDRIVAALIEALDERERRRWVA